MGGARGALLGVEVPSGREERLSVGFAAGGLGSRITHCFL